MRQYKLSFVASRFPETPIVKYINWAGCIPEPYQAGLPGKPHNIYEYFSALKKHDSIHIKQSGDNHTCRETLLYSLKTVNNLFRSFYNVNLLALVTIKTSTSRNTTYEMLKTIFSYDANFKVFNNKSGVTVQFYYSDEKACRLSLYLYMIRFPKQLRELLESVEEVEIARFKSKFMVFLEEASKWFLEKRNEITDTNNEFHLLSYYCYKESTSTYKPLLGGYCNGPNSVSKFLITHQPGTFQDFIREIFYPAYKEDKQILHEINYSPFYPIFLRKITEILET